MRKLPWLMILTMLYSCGGKSGGSSSKPRPVAPTPQSTTPLNDSVNKLKDVVFEVEKDQESPLRDEVEDLVSDVEELTEELERGDITESIIEDTVELEAAIVTTTEKIKRKCKVDKKQLIRLKDKTESLRIDLL